MIVYCCHPVASYGTEHEQRQLAALDRHLPGAELVNPAQLFTSNTEWAEAWPRLVRTLQALVCFGDEDNIIGAGCWSEIGDAIACQVPVAALDNQGGLRQLFGLQLLLGTDRSPGRAGKLELGKRTHLGFTEHGQVVWKVGK